MQDNICKAIISLTGVTFIIKYSIRILPWPATALVCVAYALFMYYFFKTLSHKVSNNTHQRNKALLVSLITVVTVAVLCVAIFSNPYHLNVDRWSALWFTIDSTLAGRYPYNVVTHLGNHCSTMPAWMAFHIPFRLAGCLGMSLVLSLILFVMAIKSRFGLTAATKTMLVIVVCPSFWYEIVVISDLQTNFFLLASFLCWATSESRLSSKKNLYVTAAIAGLFLSTRLTVCIPLLFFLFPVWHSRPLSQKLFLPLICISVYAATLAPFVFWNGSTGSFAGSNPFYVQTIQYDGWAILFLFTVSAALLAGYNRNTRSKFANSAIMLFSFIAYIFTAQYICSGFSEDLFSYRYDYAYLAQSLPFASLACSLACTSGSKGRPAPTSQATS